MLQNLLENLGYTMERMGPIRYGRLWWLSLSRNFAIVQTIIMTPLSVTMFIIWLTFWLNGVKTPRHIDMLVAIYPFFTAMMLLVTMPMLARGRIWWPIFFNILPNYAVIMFIWYNIELAFHIHGGLFNV